MAILVTLTEKDSSTSVLVNLDCMTHTTQLDPGTRICFPGGAGDDHIDVTEELEAIKRKAGV